MTASKQTENVEIAQLQITTQHLTTLVERINEGLEGTHRTPGLKAQMTIANMNIESNKLAYQNVMDEVKHVEERIGKNLLGIEERLSKSLAQAITEMQKSNQKLQDETNANKTLLNKIQPWINGIAWVVTVAGGVLITMLISGKISIQP